jgi:N utilization substance protein B
MSRHKSRERALQVLFQIDARQLSAGEALNGFYNTLYATDDIPGERLEKDRFLEELVHGTLRRQPEIDDALTRHAHNWKLERMAPVERSVLRLAVYELLHGEPGAAVIIDEAVELARRFAGDEAAVFVNGVLDGVRKARQAAAPEKA